MKVAILDKESFSSLVPLEVGAYLRAHGWKTVRSLPGVGSWFANARGQEQVTIPVPQDRSLGDFLERMQDLTERLAAFENRSALTVLGDLESSGKDVIRFRLARPDLEEGSVPLEQGLEFVKCARDILNAAASSAVQPAAYFPTRSPREVAEFMGNARLAQTERGSFVVALEAPVAPTLEGQEDFLPDPFERRVTRTLAGALGALREAAIGNDATAFQRSIGVGASGNMTQALASALEICGSQGDIEIHMSWAATRPAPELPRRVAFPGYLRGPLETATEAYKGTVLMRNHEVLGRVYRLTSQENGTEAILVAEIEGRRRKIQVTFSNEHRGMLSEAFRSQQRVRCTGEMVLAVRTASLENPRRFTLVTAEFEGERLRELGAE